MTFCAFSEEHLSLKAREKLQLLGFLVEQAQSEAGEHPRLVHREFCHPHGAGGVNAVPSAHGQLAVGSRDGSQWPPALKTMP